MKALKFIGMLSLVWVLAACGSVENAPLETQAPSPCSPFQPPNESCPWGTKLISTSEDDNALGVAVGPDRSVYVVGLTRGSLTGTVTCGAFLRKYTKYGSVAWTIMRQYCPESFYERKVEVQVDSQGNAYVLLGYGGTISLSKYTSSGIHLWTKSESTVVQENYALTLNAQGIPLVMVSGSGNYHLYWYNTSGNLIGYIGNTIPNKGHVRDIATSLDGNIYLTGWWFEKPSGKFSYKAFLFVFNSSFTQVGTLMWGGTTESESVPHQIVVDSSNFIYITGYSTGGCSSVWKLTPSLATAWHYSNNEYCSESQLALDEAKNVYIVGDTSETKNSRGYIQKLSGTNGTLLWSDVIYEEGIDGRLNGVALAGGYVYAVGGSGYNYGNQPEIDYEGYVYRYDSSGTPR